MFNTIRHYWPLLLLLSTWLYVSGAFGTLSLLPGNLIKYTLAYSTRYMLDTLNIDYSLELDSLLSYCMSWSDNFYSDPFQMSIYIFIVKKCHKSFVKSEMYKKATSYYDTASLLMGYKPPTAEIKSSFETFDKSASVSFSRFGKDYTLHLPYNNEMRAKANGYKVLLVNETGVFKDVTMPPGCLYPHTATELGYKEYHVVSPFGDIKKCNTVTAEMFDN